MTNAVGIFTAALSLASAAHAASFELIGPTRCGPPNGLGQYRGCTIPNETIRAAVAYDAAVPVVTTLALRVESNGICSFATLPVVRLITSDNTESGRYTLDAQTPVRHAAADRSSFRELRLSLANVAWGDMAFPAACRVFIDAQVDVLDVTAQDRARWEQSRAEAAALAQLAIDRAWVNHTLAIQGKIFALVVGFLQDPAARPLAAAVAAIGGNTDRFRTALRAIVTSGLTPLSQAEKIALLRLATAIGQLGISDNLSLWERLPEADRTTLATMADLTDPEDLAEYVRRAAVATNEGTTYGHTAQGLKALLDQFPPI